MSWTYQSFFNKSNRCNSSLNIENDSIVVGHCMSCKKWNEKKKSRLVLFNKTCSRINPRPAKWWLVLVGKLLSFPLAVIYQLLLLITDRLLFYYYWSKNSIINVKQWCQFFLFLFFPLLFLFFTPKTTLFTLFTLFQPSLLIKQELVLTFFTLIAR